MLDERCHLISSIEIQCHLRHISSEYMFINRKSGGFEEYANIRKTEKFLIYLVSPIIDLIYARFIRMYFVRCDKQMSV